MIFLNRFLGASGNPNFIFDSTISKYFFLQQLQLARQKFEKK